MPTVTTGVDALLSLTGTTTAAGTVTKALQGVVANAARIGQEYLPEVIEGLFELSDATGTVIDDNQMALVNGAVALGDGTTLEGELLAPRRARFGRTVTNGQLVAGAILPVFSIPISAERISNLLVCEIELDLALGFPSDYGGAVELHYAIAGFTGHTTPTTLGTASDPKTVTVSLTAPISRTLISKQLIQPHFAPEVVPSVIPDAYTLKTVTTDSGLTSNAETLSIVSGSSPAALNWETAGSATINPAAGVALETPEDCFITLYIKLPADASVTGGATLDGVYRAYF